MPRLDARFPKLAPCHARGKAAAAHLGATFREDASWTPGRAAAHDHNIVRKMAIDTPRIVDVDVTGIGMDGGRYMDILTTVCARQRCVGYFRSCVCRDGHGSAVPSTSVRCWHREEIFLPYPENFL